MQLLPALPSPHHGCAACCCAPSALQASSATKQGGEKDARLQYLSWRIWHMRRRHAKVQHDRRSHDEESVLTEEATTGYSSEEDEVYGGGVKSPPRGASAERGKQREPSPLAAVACGKAAVTDVAAPAGGGGAVGALGIGEPAPKAKQLQVKVGGQTEMPALETGGLQLGGYVESHRLACVRGRCGAAQLSSRLLSSHAMGCSV